MAAILCTAVYFGFRVLPINYPTSLLKIVVHISFLGMSDSLVSPQLLNALEKKLKALLNGNITRIKR